MSINLYDISIVLKPGCSTVFLVELLQALQQCVLLSQYCRIEVIVWHDVMIDDAITSNLTKRVHCKRVIPIQENNNTSTFHQLLNQADGRVVFILYDTIQPDTNSIYKHYVLLQNRCDTLLFPVFKHGKILRFHSSIFSFAKQMLKNTGIHFYTTKFSDDTLIPYLHYLLKRGIRFETDQSSIQTLENDSGEDVWFESIQQLRDKPVQNGLLAVEANSILSLYERYPRQYEW